MAGRGRPRASSRQSAEPTPTPGRRSTRVQQAAPQQQPEEVNIDIDPAISGVQDESMPPPPRPASKRGRSQEIARVADVARRGTRRDASRTEETSLPSIVSLDGSPRELQGTLPNKRFASLSRDSLAPSSAPSPSQLRGKSRLMRKTLDRLFMAAHDSFNHLSIKDPVDQEEWDYERKSYKQALDAYRNSYTAHDSDPFANVSWALSQMGIQSNDAVLPRASQIICMANLATALDAITEIDPHLQFATLQALSLSFPKDFNALDAASGREIMDPIEIADHVSEIRTQLVIVALREYADADSEQFNPFDIVREVFFRPDVSTEEIVNLRNDPGNDRSELLKEIPGLPVMPHWGYEKLFTRIKALCNLLPDGPISGRDLQLTELEDTFPLEQSLSGLRRFIKQAFEVVRSLLQPGSAPPPQYIEPTDAEIQSQLIETLSQFSNHEHARGGVGVSSVLQLMTEMEQQGEGVARLGSQDIIAGSHQLQAATYPQISSVSYPPGFSSYAELPTQSGGVDYAHSGAPAAAGPGRKKRGADDSGQGAQAPAKKQRRGRKQNSVAEGHGTAPGSTNSFVASSQYPLPPLSGTAEDPDFDAVRIRSREISAANRKAREPQTRSAWVRNDVRLLVKAVDTFKCKWSLIQKEIQAGTIPFQIPRDQQALRDKARLLKQDFLKADGILPPSFDLVVLGKKEVNAVIACGKNPWRKEEDIRDGVPVNTEYRPPDASPELVPVEHFQALEAAAEPTRAAAPEAPMDVNLDAEADPEPLPAEPLTA